MKIVLIRPPFYAAFGSEDKAGNIPLGLCYIAASLEKEEHDVKILDCETLQLTERATVGKAQAFLKWNSAYPVYAEIMKNPAHSVWDSIAESIVAEQPDLIGFTSYTPTMSFVNYICHRVKSKSNTPIMLGGPHPTTAPLLSLTESKADFVVIGEGEKTAVELARWLETKEGSLDAIKGIAYLSDTGPRLNQPRERIDDLDSLPPAALHLLDHSQYSKEAFGYIISSRGCPFDCVFCASHTLWGRKTRQRSIKNIVDEIAHIQKQYGTDVFRFADDLFPTSHKKVCEFAEEINKRNIKIQFRCGSRVDTINEEILDALKNAGCTEISFGIESGSQRILDLISKNISADKARKAIHATKAKCIKTIAFFMIGHPSETFEEISETVSLIHELDADRTLMNLVTPFPGTGLADFAGGNRALSTEWWKYYFQGKNFQTVSSLSNQKLDAIFESVCEWVAKRNIDHSLPILHLPINEPSINKAL